MHIAAIMCLATSGGQIQTDVAFVMLKPFPKVGDCFLRDMGGGWHRQVAVLMAGNMAPTPHRNSDRCRLKDTKAGDGQYINVQYTSDGPDSKGRVIFGLNQHP